MEGAGLQMGPTHRVYLCVFVHVYVCEREREQAKDGLRGATRLGSSAITWVF